MNKNPQEFFDKILELLSSDFNKKWTVDLITSHLISEEKPDIFSEPMIREQTKTDVKNSLLFLSSESLVLYNPYLETVCITTKGFVKIKSEGFQKEIKNKRLNTKLQRVTWISSIIAVVLSTVSFITTQCSANGVYTTSSNCNHSDETISVPQKMAGQPKRKALAEEHIPQ